MQLFCRPRLPRPAIARPCREEVVAVVVYSGAEVDVKVQLMFFVMSISQVSPNDVWVVCEATVSAVS
jgi:hypothetical protein